MDYVERVRKVLETRLKEVDWMTAAETKEEALKKMGEILRLRDIINLRGSLETPDVYWDLPQLEGWADLSPSLARLVCVHIVALVPRKRSNDPLKFEDI